MKGDGGVPEPCAQVGIASRPGECRRVEFDGVDLSVGSGVRHGEGECSRPGAQVEDYGRAMIDAFEEGERPSEQQLGLRTRNEHTRTDLDVDIAQSCCAGYVLKRNTLRPLSDRLLISLDDLRLHEGHEAEPTTLDTEEVRCQQFGIDAGTGNSSSLERRRRFENCQA